MNVMVSDLNGEEQGGEYAHGARWGGMHQSSRGSGQLLERGTPAEMRKASGSWQV